MRFIDIDIRRLWNKYNDPFIDWDNSLLPYYWLSIKQWFNWQKFYWFGGEDKEKFEIEQNKIKALTRKYNSYVKNGKDIQEIGLELMAMTDKCIFSIFSEKYGNWWMDKETRKLL